jgi:transcriptional regulator with XRE-family HTH domain
MAKAQPGTSADLELGARLRLLRESRGLSLRSLARLARITPGTLSQLENGKTSPTVGTLKNVLAAMGTSLGEFFTLHEGENGGDRFVCRAGELVDISPGPGIRFLTLPASVQGRALQCLHETYAPGADTGKQPYRHKGEETGFCLAGTIEITVGGQREVIGPGDSYYYLSDQPHRWRNVGSAPAEVISCCTPPSF